MIAIFFNLPYWPSLISNFIPFLGPILHQLQPNIMATSNPQFCPALQQPTTQQYIHQMTPTSFSSSEQRQATQSSYSSRQQRKTHAFSPLSSSGMGWKLQEKGVRLIWWKKFWSLNLNLGSFCPDWDPFFPPKKKNRTLSPSIYSFFRFS